MSNGDYDVDEDDQLLANFINRLWGEDWNSPEDAVYDDEPWDEK